MPAISDPAERTKTIPDRMSVLNDRWDADMAHLFMNLV